MQSKYRVAVLSMSALLAGCSAYNTEPKSIVLPTSNRSIDLIQHRSDVRFSDCGTLLVLQTYNADGSLIDSKEARGSALHCTVLPALIDAGGRVGGAYVGRSPISIRNSQAQGQGQLQGQSSSNTNINANANTNTNTATGGAGGNGGQGGQGGNNGGGNGDNDGTNNGTDNHHNNGDNN